MPRTKISAQEVLSCAVCNPSSSHTSWRDNIFAVKYCGCGTAIRTRPPTRQPTILAADRLLIPAGRSTCALRRVAGAEPGQIAFSAVHQMRLMRKLLGNRR
ncbi:hypothetical protein KCP78_16310 [Salmonella enterica subsp. enterica]|nr:hypothetical protein KCP78_16310 [Salmonella enterica subsp. enterica]